MKPTVGATVRKQLQLDEGRTRGAEELTLSWRKRCGFVAIERLRVAYGRYRFLRVKPSDENVGVRMMAAEATRRATGSSATIGAVVVTVCGTTCTV